MLMSSLFARPTWRQQITPGQPNQSRDSTVSRSDAPISSMCVLIDMAAGMCERFRGSVELDAPATYTYRALAGGPARKNAMVHGGRDFAAGGFFYRTA